jgi:Raf kinase inhibitor-like YbhB/YbcL family protein
MFILMDLQSPAFKIGDLLPPKYTCNGSNVNPPLTWSMVPPATQSFLLLIETVHLADMPQVHWLIGNIPSDQRALNEAETPHQAVVCHNSNNQAAYDGPCPKNFHGSRQLRFLLLALDSNLDISTRTSRDSVLKQAEPHILAKAELTTSVKGDLDPGEPPPID